MSFFEELQDLLVRAKDAGVSDDEVLGELEMAAQQIRDDMANADD